MPRDSVREIPVAGHMVKVRSVGKGTPLLVLPDVFGPRVWPPALDRLAQQHEIIYVEHPGFDGGPRPEWLDTVADLAMAYLDLLDRLDLRDCNLLGFGIGGWIAADLATRNPARLRSLVLVGAHGLLAPEQTPPDIFLQSEESLMRAWFADAAQADAAIERELASDSEDLRLRNQELAARMTWEPRLHDPQMIKWLHRIACPTLVVWGEQDEILPAVYALEWQRRLPRSTVSVVGDCGHAPQLERPDSFAGLVEGFLARPGC